MPGNGSKYSLRQYITWDLITHSPDRAQRSLPNYLARLTITFLLSSGFHMALLHRLAHWCHRHYLLPISLVLEKVIYHWYHCLVPSSVEMGPAVWFPHPLGIVIAKGTKIGRSARIFQHAQVLGYKRSMVIGDCVRMSAGSMVVGADIQSNVILAPGAVVTKDVPADSVAKGVPAVAAPMTSMNRALVWDILSKDPWHKWPKEAQ